MVKILVAFDTKYGNTHRVAEMIAEGLRNAGSEAMVRNMKEVDLETIIQYDGILIGSPNHIGRPTRTFKKFTDRLRKLNLKDITVAAFDTYVGDDGPGGKEFQKALLKMEAHIQEKLPELKLTPGLSIAVKGMKGPVYEVEWAKCREFGQKFATRLSG